MFNRYFPVLLSILYCAPTFPSDVLKIVPLGDSITQGVGNDYPKALGYDSYRRLLYLKLVEAGHKVDFVGSMNKAFKCGDPANKDFDPDHEGHWAWRVDEIINGKKNGCRGSGRLSQWLEGYTADLALIHLGTNDMFQKQNVDATLRELEKVIDIFREDNPKIVIFLAKVLPAGDDPGRSARVKALNSKIHLVSENRNTLESPVILVDHYTDFIVDTETFDGVHPNLSGEEIMAQRWFDAIDNHLKTQEQ